MYGQDTVSQVRRTLLAMWGGPGADGYAGVAEDAPGGNHPNLELSSDRYAVNGERLYALCTLNCLADSIKEPIYRQLLPFQVLQRFGIDPDTLGDKHGNSLVRYSFPSGSGVLKLDVRPERGFPDPLLHIELVDNCLNQIELLLLTINDPSSERFDTDRDERGEPTLFGTVRRNHPEEVRAMQAGLAPGQVRHGLRLGRTMLSIVEDFVSHLGRDHFVVEPLAYHNAILFERMGFGYVQGLPWMRWIHDAFQPGAPLHQTLDSSTPFRRPSAWRTVRGRSWAIHDGVLGEPWDGVKMVKFVGRDAGVDTFHAGAY
jgi:hypothetical protein